jgi:hypothetical protein
VHHVGFTILTLQESCLLALFLHITQNLSGSFKIVSDSYLEQKLDYLYLNLYLKVLPIKDHKILCFHVYVRNYSVLMSKLLCNVFTSG